MPFAKDGSGHHSFTRAKMHDEKSMGSAKPPAKTHSPEPKARSMKDPGKGESEQGMEGVVAEHGPAHGMHYAKVGDEHHVVSHHADGHVHHAKHGSFGEAHEHMKQGGEESAEQEPQETPDSEQEPAYASNGGGGIPGLNS